MSEVITCHAVLTAVGGTVLVLFVSWLLFLLSSSLTGSLTLTPWYGLGLARADDGAREGGGREGKSAHVNCSPCCPGAMPWIDLMSSQCRRGVSKGHSGQRRHAKRERMVHQMKLIAVQEVAVNIFFQLYHVFNQNVHLSLPWTFLQLSHSMAISSRMWKEKQYIF